MNITQHFTLEEFHSHDGKPYPTEWIADRLRPLCEMLEVIRERVGGPLVILSGYRSPEHNTAVGGARHSQHVAGRAADIQAPGVDPGRVHELVLELAAERPSRIIQLGGLGRYPTFTHVDVRHRFAGEGIARWSGR